MYLLGKLYEARKHVRGSEKGGYGNQYNKSGDGQKLANTKNKDGVSKIVADEQGVGKTTVKNAYLFSKGIDTIK